jgi:hypothetical protein
MLQGEIGWVAAGLELQASKEQYIIVQINSMTGLFRYSNEIPHKIHHCVI